MKCAICPSCEIKKYSASVSSDGLCDECAGRDTKEKRLRARKQKYAKTEGKA